MVKRILTEADIILKKIDKNYVIALSNLFKDKKNIDLVLEILDMIKGMDSKKILDIAGSANSLDTLINGGIEQAFRRGRISLSVLFRALLVNAGKELEHRENSKKDAF